MNERRNSDPHSYAALKACHDELEKDLRFVYSLDKLCGSVSEGMDLARACRLRVEAAEARAKSAERQLSARNGTTEAVAWQRFSERLGWTNVDADYAKTLAAGGETVRPLYAHPPSVQVAEDMPNSTAASTAYQTHQGEMP